MALAKFKIALWKFLHHLDLSGLAVWSLGVSDVLVLQRVVLLLLYFLYRSLRLWGALFEVKAPGFGAPVPESTIEGHHLELRNG